MAAIAAGLVGATGSASASGPPDASPVSTTLESTALLNAGEYFQTGFSDGTYAYLTGNGVPARVVKIRLSDATLVDTITLYNFPLVEWLVSRIETATSDGTHGYFVNREGIVVKVRLSDMTVVGAVTLNLADGGEIPSATTSDGAFLYIGTRRSLSRDANIFKVRMSDLATVATNPIPGDDSVTSALSDGTHLYFTTTSIASTGRAGQLLKIRAADNNPAYIRSMSVAASTGVIDGGFLYYATDTQPAKVLKIQTTSTLLQVSEVDLPVSYVAASALDGANLYLTTYVPIGESGEGVSNGVVQVRLSDLTVTGQITDVLDQWGRVNVALASASYVWAGGYSEPGTFLAIRTTVRGRTTCGFIDAARIPTWAREGACWLKDRRVTTSNAYDPGGVLTRAQMAAFLWRAAGQPPAATTCGFRDQAQIPSWARQGACWLKANNITANNPFNPSGVLTRSQLAAFMWRAAGEPELGTQNGACSFKDRGAIPEWARRGACWVAFHEITANNPFNPGGTVTRAQLAAFLFRGAYLKGAI